MKSVILSALLAVLSCSVLVADAIVLDAGSSISSPDGDFFVLENASFLLSRSDMEEAVLALETVPIEREARLRAEAKARLVLPLCISTGIAGVVLGIVVTLLTKGTP